MEEQNEEWKSKLLGKTLVEDDAETTLDTNDVSQTYLDFFNLLTYIYRLLE